MSPKPSMEMASPCSKPHFDGRPIFFEAKLEWHSAVKTKIGRANLLRCQIGMANPLPSQSGMANVFRRQTGVASPLSKPTNGRAAHFEAMLEWQGLEAKWQGKPTSKSTSRKWQTPSRQVSPLFMSPKSSMEWQVLARSQTLLADPVRSQT